MGGNEKVTEKNFDASLNAIGMLMAGEITIRKDIGSDDVLVSTKMHPFMAMYLIVRALEEMLWRAGETGDDLQLDLSGGNAREILNGFAELMADDIEKSLIEKEGNKGERKR